MEWESRDGEGRGWMMSGVGQRAREWSDGNNAMYFPRPRGGRRGHVDCARGPPEA